MIEFITQANHLSQQGIWPPFGLLNFYSPLHNIKSNTAYLATLITTADHVVSAHSFKFAATLQQHQAGSNRKLIRIETKSGHGSSK